VIERKDVRLQEARSVAMPMGGVTGGFVMMMVVGNGAHGKPGVIYDL
jgi:hypothetical protein